jgi:hypothetical protein
MDEKSEAPLWAVVEIFGHQTYVGQVQQHAIGGCAFVRVDVPAIDDQPAYTKIFGERAIYSITPVAEDLAHELIKRHRPSPVSIYLLPVLHGHRGRSYEKDDADSDQDIF